MRGRVVATGTSPWTTKGTGLSSPWTGEDHAIFSLKRVNTPHSSKTRICDGRLTYAILCWAKQSSSSPAGIYITTNITSFTQLRKCLRAYITLQRLCNLEGSTSSQCRKSARKVCESQRTSFCITQRRKEDMARVGNSQTTAEQHCRGSKQRWRAGYVLLIWRRHTREVFLCKCGRKFCHFNVAKFMLLRLISLSSLQHTSISPTFFRCRRSLCTSLAGWKLYYWLYIIVRLHWRRLSIWYHSLN